MKAQQLREMFPHANEAFIRMNAEDVMDMPALKSEVLPMLKSPIRQRRGGKSKLQQAFLDFKRAEMAPYPDSLVLDEPFALRLGAGVMYRPDVAVIFRPNVGSNLYQISCYEVKGPFFWPAAKVKLKVVASVMPWIDFYLVKREGRAGPWLIQQIAK